ncbi:hypothetical protein TELCIR_19207, partial [Teladorsagia circumcincta]
LAMHCLIALLLPITGSLAAIRCFQGQETIPGQIIPYVPVNCPTADFCFNSYVKRHHNGDDSYTITKSCGEVGKCYHYSLKKFIEVRSENAWPGRKEKRNRVKEHLLKTTEQSTTKH